MYEIMYETSFMDLLPILQFSKYSMFLDYNIGGKFGMSNNNSTSLELHVLRLAPKLIIV